MDTVKINLSNSALDRFIQCPLSYYHAYLNPEHPLKEGVNDFYADYGSLMHFFAEMYPRTNYYPDMEWKENKEDTEETVGSYLKSYSNLIMGQKVVLDIPKMMKIYDYLFPMIKFPSEDKRSEYYDQGVAFIEKLPKMDWSKVIGLEKYFKFQLDDSIQPVTGIIDKVERDENGLIVTDYKTSKPYSENAIMQKMQLPIYGMACYFLFGEIPHTYRYHFIRFDKVVEVNIPTEKLTRVKNIIKFQYMKIVSFLNQGKFPAQYSDFYCKNFCGFSRLCPTFYTFNPQLGGN